MTRHDPTPGEGGNEREPHDCGNGEEHGDESPKGGVTDRGRDVLRRHVGPRRLAGMGVVPQGALVHATLRHWVMRYGLSYRVDLEQVVVSAPGPFLLGW